MCSEGVYCGEKSPRLFVWTKTAGQILGSIG